MSTGVPFIDGMFLILGAWQFGEIVGIVIEAIYNSVRKLNRG